MSSFQAMLDVQMLILILMGVGFLIKRLKILPDNAHTVLSSLLINVFLPCNIVMSFRIPEGDSPLNGLFVSLIIGFVFQFGMWALSKLMFNQIDPSRGKILKYGIICSNASFMGIPLAEAMFGQAGAMYASVNTLALRVFVWSAGLSLFTKVEDWKKTARRLLVHPCIASVLIGLAFMLTEFKLPAVLETSLLTLSRCTTPVSMIVIGLILGGVELRQLWDKQLILFSAVRLIWIPLAVLAILTPLKIPDMIVGVTVLQAGMPAGTTTAILAARYGADEKYGSRCVLLSTLGSVVTLPLWIGIIGQFFQGLK